TPGGNVITVHLSGTQTVRYVPTSGDYDYLAFVPGTVQIPRPRITGINVSGGNVTITWTGGGTLFSTPSLLNPTWTTTGSSTGTFTEPVGRGNKFYRVQQ